jgi:hypothetical protein
MEPDRKTSTGGRPVEYTDEIGMAISERLVEGESLRAICAGPGMPAKATIGWLARHQEFRKRYELAQTMVLECLMDEAIAIVDDTAGDWVEMVRRGEGWSPSVIPSTSPAAGYASTCATGWRTT